MPKPDDDTMRVLRMRAKPEATKELVTALEIKIAHADRNIRRVGDEFDRMNKERISDVNLQLIDMARWQVRRQTLIEVWELVTNQVWRRSV